MQYIDLIEARRPVLSDYTQLGLDPATATNYLNAKIPPESAAAYQRGVARYPSTTFSEILSDWKTRKRHQREDRAYNKLVAALPQLAVATTPLTHDEACAIIANDDDLFGAIDMHISGDPDWYEKTPQDAERLRAIIQRIKPFRHPPLYRGECRHHGEHVRGFHSWTLNRETADYFWKDCGHGRGQLLRLLVPVQAVEFERIGTWRMRLRQGESHYLGSQSEWLVPDRYPFTVIAER